MDTKQHQSCQLLARLGFLKLLLDGKKTHVAVKLRAVRRDGKPGKSGNRNLTLELCF